MLLAALGAGQVLVARRGGSGDWGGGAYERQRRDSGDGKNAVDPPSAGKPDVRCGHRPLARCSTVATSITCKHAILCFQQHAPVLQRHFGSPADSESPVWLCELASRRECLFGCAGSVVSGS